MVRKLLLLLSELYFTRLWEDRNSLLCRKEEEEEGHKWPHNYVIMSN